MHGVPPALAHAWQGQAAAIAAAASAGDNCRALNLATALHRDVLDSEQKLPRRLRSPLLVGVNSLVHRITCTPGVPPPSKKPTAPKEPKPPKEHHEHGHHEHHHGHGEGGDEK